MTQDEEAFVHGKLAELRTQLEAPVPKDKTAASQLKISYSIVLPVGVPIPLRYQWRLLGWVVSKLTYEMSDEQANAMGQWIIDLHKREEWKLVCRDKGQRRVMRRRLKQVLKLLIEEGYGSANVMRVFNEVLESDATRTNQDIVEVFYERAKDSRSPFADEQLLRDAQIVLDEINEDIRDGIYIDEVIPRTE